MIICRSRILLAALALFAVGLPSYVSAQYWPDAKECSNIDVFAERACISSRVEVKERELVRLYEEALVEVKAQFKEYGHRDDRLDPDNFVQAQVDWKRFVDSNCESTGAYGGGSNSSISDRIFACYEYELDRRIELFTQMADGSYGLFPED